MSAVPLQLLHAGGIARNSTVYACWLHMQTACRVTYAAKHMMLVQVDAATSSDDQQPPDQNPPCPLETSAGQQQGWDKMLKARCASKLAGIEKHGVQASLRAFAHARRVVCGQMADYQWITRPIVGAQADSLSTQLEAVGVRQGDGTFQGRLGAMWARRVQLAVAIARTGWWVSASV
jgi:hypothetical protein